jgi:hypothetical protein
MGEKYVHVWPVLWRRLIRRPFRARRRGTVFPGLQPGLNPLDPFGVKNHPKFRLT